MTANFTLKKIQTCKANPINIFKWISSKQCCTQRKIRRCMSFLNKIWWVMTYSTKHSHVLTLKQHKLKKRSMSSIMSKIKRKAGFNSFVNNHILELTECNRDGEISGI